MANKSEIDALREAVNVLQERANTQPQGYMILPLGETLVTTETPGYFMFWAPPNTYTWEIWLKATPFPEAFYTELPYHRHSDTAGAHTHGATGLSISSHSITDSGHLHAVGTLAVSAHAAHSITDSGHDHDVDSGTGSTQTTTTVPTGISIATHATHTLSGNTGSKTTSIAITDHTIGGTTASGTGAEGNTGYAGINAATLNDTEKTSVDDLVTVAFCSDGLGGFSSWSDERGKSDGVWGNLDYIDGDTGTGWIDFSDDTVGIPPPVQEMVWIRITEPTAKKGGRVSAVVRLSFVDEDQSAT